MNYPVRWLRGVAVGVLGLSLVGCASIVHSGNRPVTINSDPPGALVTITGRHGRVVASQTTPFTAKLDPLGGYFKGQKYIATFELAGYAPADAFIYPEFSPWYIGNIVFGGLIGFVVVDPLTGCMWNERPLHLEQTLVKLPEPAAVTPPPVNAPPPAVSAPVGSSEVVTPAVQAPMPPASDNTNAPAPPVPAVPSP